MNLAAKNYREVIEKSYEGAAARAGSNNTLRNSVQSLNKKVVVKVTATAANQQQDENMTGTLNFRKINDLLYKSSHHPNRVEPGVIDLSSSSGQGFINEAPPPKGNLKLN